MFIRAKDQSKLEIEIDRLMNHMANLQIDTEEYEKTLERLIKLHKMKEEEKTSGVSADTVLLAATNILGIVLIIRHEHVNVISSKAMSLVTKPKA